MDGTKKKKKIFTFRMSVIQGVVWCSGRNSRKKRIEQTKSNHKTIVYKTKKKKKEINTESDTETKFDKEEKYETVYYRASRQVLKYFKILTQVFSIFYRINVGFFKHGPQSTFIAKEKKPSPPPNSNS